MALQWVKLHRKASPNFKMLDAATRGVWYEILRVVDEDTGEFGLGRGGFATLAREIGIHLRTVNRAIRNLIQNDSLELRGQVLRVVNWERYQAGTNRVFRRVSQSNSGVSPKHEVKSAYFGPRFSQDLDSDKDSTTPLPPSSQRQRPPERKPPPPPPASAGGAERAVLEHWETRTGVFPGPPALAYVRARMDEGCSAEELCYALDGYGHSPGWVRGGFCDAIKSVATVRRWKAKATKLRLPYPNFEAAA